MGIGKWAGAALVAAAALGWTSGAVAQDVSAACADYATKSPQMKELPAPNRTKWCACMAERVPAAQAGGVAQVFRAHRDAEVAGGAFSPDTLPGSLKPAGDLYFNVMGACLPVALGMGPPTTPPVQGSAAAAPKGQSKSSSAAPRERNVEKGGPNRVTGAAAWRLLVGNTVTVTVDGKEYTDYYDPNGTIYSLHDGERGKGEWTFDKGQVCLAYPKEDEDCFDVAVEGDTAIFTDDEGGSLRLRILKGNARRL